MTGAISLYRKCKVISYRVKKSPGILIPGAKFTFLRNKILLLGWQHGRNKTYKVNNGHGLEPNSSRTCYHCVE